MKKNTPEFALAPLAGKKGKKGKKKVHSIHVTKAKGGYIAEHNSNDGMSPEKHVLPDMAALKAHMAKHLAEDEVAEGKQPASEEVGE